VFIHIVWTISAELYVCTTFPAIIIDCCCETIMPVAAPAAAMITARETLGLLDGPFRSFAEGVVEDRYALWIGSGISRGRVADLSRVILRVLAFLQEHVTPGVANCRFRSALMEALALAFFGHIGNSGGVGERRDEALNHHRLLIWIHGVPPPTGRNDGSPRSARSSAPVRRTVRCSIGPTQGQPRRHNRQLS
jgi:hypothetical protein